MKKNSLQKLIDESLAIEAQAAKEAGALGYMARVLTQVTMPHSKVGGTEFIRKNGWLTLSITAPSIIGLPYGNMPRLILAWVTTEAVRTKQRELILGRSLGSFIDKLGLVSSGGANGTITRLKKHLKSLFGSTIHYMYEYDQNTKKADIGEIISTDHMKGEGLIKAQIAKEYHLWWQPQNPNQAGLWESTVTLDDEFFNSITQRPIPIDMRALQALKRSPLALDIYCWLTYRMSYLDNPSEIPWAALQMQFGSSYSFDEQGIRNFKKAFLRELKKVCLIYSNAKVSEGRYGLMLRPSPSHIPSSV